MKHSIRSIKKAGSGYLSLIRLWMVLLTAGFFLYGNAQVAPLYTFAQSAGSFTVITGGTQLENTTNIIFLGEIGSFDDDISAAQTIPAFTYNGITYTQMYVSANGFITFGAAPSGGNYAPLSSTEGYAGAVSAVGCDLHNTTNGITSTRDIRWQTVGNEIVVQWRGVRRKSVGSEGFAFQIRLNTANSAIRVVYGPFAQGPGTNTAIQPEAGLRGPNNSFATQVNNRLVSNANDGISWGNSQPGTSNNSKLRLSSTAPAKAWTNGLTYTWTPICTPILATTNVARNCAAGTYSINVNITGLGGASNVTIQSPNGTDVIAGVGTGSYVINGIPLGTSRTVRIVHNGSSLCNRDLGTITDGDPDGVCQAAGVHPIPDNGCGTSTFRDIPFCVSTAGTALGANVFVQSVDLIVSHTYNSDLEIGLISPSGTNVSLIADRFGTGDNLGNPSNCPNSLFTLQAGGIPLSNGNASNVIGTYAPEQPLTGFHNGTDPNGTWTLRACDDEAADNGAIRFVRLNLCLAAQATFTAVNNCASNQFSVQVNVTSLGSGTNANLNYTVNGSPFSLPGIGAGITTIGPFPATSEVICTLSGGTNGCGSVAGTMYSSCPVTLDCGATLNVSHCYRNNDTRTFTFLSPVPGETVTLSFIQGSLDLGDVVNIYDGTDNLANSLGGGNFSGNLAGTSFTSTGPAIYVEISSNGSNSCADGGQTTPWLFEVRCTPGCQQPGAFVDVTNNCAAYNFTLDVSVFYVGDGLTADVVYTVNGGTPVELIDITEGSTVNLGPFSVGDQVHIMIEHDTNPLCNLNLGTFTNTVACPSAENCVNALNLGMQTSPLAGTTTGRTNDFSFACGTATANTAPDAIYYIDVPNGAQLNIRQQSNTYNSQHYVRFGGTCPGTTVIACVNDDAGEIGWVNWVNTTGSTQRVWWIQDGFGAASGNFVLQWQLITCPIAPGPPSAGTTAYSMCQNGTVPNGQGLSASCANVAQTTSSAFPSGGLISEGTTMTTRATIVVPALPAGAVITAARLRLTNVVANSNILGNAQRQNIRVALAGAYTLGGTQLTTTTDAGTVSPNPLVINLPGFPVAGGTIDFRTRQTTDQLWTNPDVNIGSASIEVDYTVPTSVRWYSAPLAGTLVFTGPLFNPPGQSAVNNTVPGTTTFYATCGYGTCENIRIPATFSVVAAPNAGTNGTLTICSNASPESLATQLGGSPQGGGTWSGPSPVVGGQYNPVTMDPGTYVYTVAGSVPCPNATANVVVTENTATLWYADVDGDGFGDPASSLQACTPPLDHVANNTDLCPADVLKQIAGICGCGVADTDSDNDGTANCNDGCPNDPNKIAPGICGCGVADTDSDNDGTANCNDGCPNDPNKIASGICGCGVADTDSDNDGTANCNDGCPNDPNKIVPGICGCGVADTDSDNDGTANCNDACPNDPNKIAAGVCGCGVADVPTTYYADVDGDGFGDPASSVSGFTCVTPFGYVSNNVDCNDSQLQYADMDGDGAGAGVPVACGVASNTDDCPTVVGVQGSNCNASMGFGFVLGQLNASCQCVAIACTENVTLELRTDANSAQAGWEILNQNTSLVLCSGGYPNSPFPNGITSPITSSCCLPAGCYRLRVLDGGGDGFVSGGVTGGYQLRESGINGRRIIENLANFTTGSTSGLANTLDNGAFCLPLAPVGTNSSRPIFSSCDKMDWVYNQFIVATEDLGTSAQHITSPANSGYEFWFYDPNGSFSYRRFRSHATTDGFGTGATRACHLKIRNTPFAEVPADLLLNVRIRCRIAGVNQPFGPACLFKIDAARAACPLVKLQDNPLNTADFSCGVTRSFGGGNSPGNRITANPPQFSPAINASLLRYQFRFRITGEGVCIVRPPQTSAQIVLNWTTGQQLECTKTYSVDVRVSKDGGATWCIDNPVLSCSGPITPWGKICNVLISTSTFCPNFTGGSSSMALQGDGDGNLTLYPNPNSGDQLRVFWSAPEVRATDMVYIEIYDLTGKRMQSVSFTEVSGLLDATMTLDGSLASGVYLVHLTAGTTTRTQRLVVQR